MAYVYHHAHGKLGDGESMATKLEPWEIGIAYTDVAGDRSYKICSADENGNEICIAEQRTDAYHYAGSVTTFSDLPYSEKYAAITLEADQSIYWKLPPVPTNATGIKVKARRGKFEESGNPSTASNLKIRFCKDTTDKIEINSLYFYNNSYAVEQYNFNQADLTQCNRIKFAGGAHSVFDVSRIWWIDADGRDIGTVLEFTEISIKDTNAVTGGGGAIEKTGNCKARVKLEPSTAPLPAGGEMWNILDTGRNYAWTGEEWDSLSGVVDLTGYQTKSDIALQTTAKTVVGAINEVKDDTTALFDNTFTLSRDKQDKTDEALILDDNLDGNVVLAIKNTRTRLDVVGSQLSNNKQDKTDINLETTDKTVVGAINEVSADVDSLKSVMSGVYKYKGSVNDISVLPNGDKVLHAIGSQSQSIEFKFLNGMIPEDATTIKFIAKANAHKSFTLMFYNDDYTQSVSRDIWLDTEYRERDIDIQDVDKTLYNRYRFSFSSPGSSEFFLDKAWFINNTTWKTVGVMQNFDYYNIDSDGDCEFKTCNSAKVEFKNPKVDVEVGSVYNVTKTDDNYAWNGDDWDKLGGITDLSLYQTKTDYRLQTESKDIVTAINSLNTQMGDISTLLDTINGEVI